MAFPTFKTKAEIPKGFEDEYEEGEDKTWAPKDAAADIRVKLVDEREKREAAEKLTRTAAKELKKLEAEALAHKSGVTEDQLKEMRASIRAEVETEFAPFKQAAETLAVENRALTLDRVINAQLAGAGFLGDKVDYVWQLHAGDFDLTDDKKPMVKGKPGTTVEKHIEGLKKLHPEWVQGTKADGGGANGVVAATTTAQAANVDAIIKDPRASIEAARAAGKKE